MNRKKILDFLAWIVVIGAIAGLVVLFAAPKANADPTRWPQQFTVRGTAVGDTVFSGPGLVAAKMSVIHPVIFCKKITATGSMPLPRLNYELVADGDGFEYRLINKPVDASDPGYSGADSLVIDSMGTATNIWLYGY